MASAMGSIARFTVLEGIRGRTLVMALAVVAGAWLVAEFAAGLAITDSLSYRSGIYAWIARPALTLILVLAVASSIVRELNDRLLDLTWSRPVSRAAWFTGRLLGFVLLACVFALLAGAPLLINSAPPAVGVWTASLALELTLLAAAALTATVTLRQLTLAVTATAGFYLLARTIDAIVLMTHGPTVDPNHWSSELVARIVEFIALLLPALARFTDSAWLYAGVESGVLAAIVAETTLFVILLVAAGLFDVYRLDD